MNKATIKNWMLATIVALLMSYPINWLFNGLTVPSWEHMIWGLLSNALSMAVLLFYGLNSKYRGRMLTLSLFTIYFVIGYLNTLIEAFIFHVSNREQTMLELIQGALISWIITMFISWLLKTEKTKEDRIFIPSRTTIQWTLKFLMATLLYLFFYLLAGMLLQMNYPELMQFYEGKLPSFELMLLTQVPRSWIFALIAILIISSLELKRLQQALYIGVAFSVLGGIAPLIYPNELMPQNIRIAHGIEVGISNFLFGVLLTQLLLGKKKKVI